MEEDCAAQPLHARTPIVAGDHNHVVKPIIAAEILMRSGVRKQDEAVVVPVAHSFAPAPSPPHRQDGQGGLGPCCPVGPVEHFNQIKAADWTCAVTLALQAAAAAAADCTGENQSANRDPALCGAPACRANVKRCDYGPVLRYAV